MREQDAEEYCNFVTAFCPQTTELGLGPTCGIGRAHSRFRGRTGPNRFTIFGSVCPSSKQTTATLRRDTYPYALYLDNSSHPKRRGKKLALAGWTLNVSGGKYIKTWRKKS